MRWGSIFRGRIIMRLPTPLGGSSFEGKEAAIFNDGGFFCLALLRCCIACL